MDNKNMILAVVFSVVILVAWQRFYDSPRREQQRAQQVQQEQAAAEEKKAASDATTAGPSTSGERPRLGADTAALGIKPKTGPGITREAALKKAPRIAIMSPRLDGSISLVGGRVDDLLLRDYHTELDKSSPEIVLLNPAQSERPYYAEFGWLGQDVKTPTGSTLWSTTSSELTPQSPVTLTWDNGAGLIFERQYSLDDNYLITVTQRVRNNAATAVTLAPYGLISRTGTPKTLGFYILHEGPLGVFDDVLEEVKYKDLRELRDDENNAKKQFSSVGGWLGITDKYWLVALIPDQKSNIESSFFADRRGGEDLYQADYLGKPVPLAAGASIETTVNLFTGAKEVKLIDKYEKQLGVEHFDKAVDFGWFYPLTKPIFYAILWLNDHLGNFGLAILALTVTIKLIFFPLANKSYKSMSKMKKLQPKMVKLRETYGEDRQRLNQEMMALYKREKVNPASGCLPMLIQIPVFFSLYKVLFVNIEMRHAPFYGWIHDLSVPDPLGVLTLFGFFPWDVPASLHILNIGVWPLLMGISMFLQQRLNPAPADPVQAKIFMFMPIVFTFMLGRFPAGLVIYWTWNNVLSMTQQWVIMKRMGVPIGGGSAPAGGST